MQLSEMTTGMAHGAEDAYARFYQEYQRRLYRYVYVLVGGRADEALDVSQDTMLRVMRHIREFHSEPVFWDWLTCLARSAATDSGRKASRWARLLRTLSDQPPVTPPMTPPEDMAPLLQRALTMLSEDDQALLSAKYSGRSVRELAVELGQSEGAIESRLVRLRARIREQVLEWKRHEPE